MVSYDKRALRRLLVAAGIDEMEIAERSGLKRQTVNYIARGMTVPRATTLAKIASALGVSVEAFFARKAA